MDKKTEDQLNLIYKAIDDKKGEDIKVIDVQELTPVTDYFVIATADNFTQLNAMRDNVDEMLGQAGFNVRSIEGDKQSAWILMDYNNVVVNLFERDARHFYDLDRMWKDGKEVGLS
jgi:ribosome-associated protein